MSAVTTLKKDEEDFGDNAAEKGKGKDDDDDSDDEDEEEIFLRMRQQRNDPAVKGRWVYSDS